MYRYISILLLIYVPHARSGVPHSPALPLYEETSNVVNGAICGILLERWLYDILKPSREVKREKVDGIDPSSLFRSSSRSLSDVSLAMEDGICPEK